MRNNAPSQDRSLRAVAAMLLIALPAIVFIPVWRLGGVSGMEDDLLYYFPIRTYIGERIAGGDWPMWNPLVAMGVSIPGDPQAGLWYPTTWLFAVLPPHLAYCATLLLHFWLAGAGMYRFLRALRHDRHGALIGAVAFQIGGFLIAHRVHLTMHHAATWLPWLLYAWQRFANTGHRKYVACAALALGMQLLVQHIQVTIISLTLLTAYVAVILVRSRRATLWWYPIGCIVGVLISAVQILPTWFHYRDSVRGSISFATFTENSWEPLSAALLMFPMLYGERTPNLTGDAWWGLSHWCEQACYLSIGVLLLAACTLRDVRRNREAAFWWGAIGVSLLLSLGAYTPLSYLLFQVPIYGSLRVPARWTLVWSIAIPVLASTWCCAINARRVDYPTMSRRIRRAFDGLFAFGVLTASVLLAINHFDFVETLLLRDHYQRPQFMTGLRDRSMLMSFYFPLGMLSATSVALLLWLRDNTARRYALVLAVIVTDLAIVAASIDVDRTKTYAAIQRQPPLAARLHRLGGTPTDRLLVPRTSSDYTDPAPVLWPEINLHHDVPTLSAYGPFVSSAGRLLFGFEAWGSSDNMLGLLRNPPLLEAMGVRFIAVRSDQERALLHAAMIPALEQPDIQPIGSSTTLTELRPGTDVRWPVDVDATGVFELSFDAEPIRPGTGRWFVRLEMSAGEQIDHLHIMRPSDLAMGPRRFRLFFHCPQPIDDAWIRINGEHGANLRVGRATFGQVAAGEPQPETSPIQLLDELEGNVALYELRQEPTTPRPVLITANLNESVERLTDTTAKPCVTITQAEFDRAGIENRNLQAVKPVLSIEDGGDTMTIDAQVDSDTLVVVNQAYAPGWRATIDGDPAPVVRVNAVQMGVYPTRVGKVEIRLTFHPPGLRAGIVLTLVGLALCLPLLARTRRRLPA